MRIPEELSLAGLAAKAGKVVSGEFATEKAVKTGKAFLVITARDASENTKKKFNDMCRYYQVPILHHRVKGGVGKSHREGIPGVAGAYG